MSNIVWLCINIFYLFVPCRFVLTGHSNGAIQMWDLSTALDFFHRGVAVGGSTGGPTPQVHTLDPKFSSATHCLETKHIYFKLLYCNCRS